MKTDPGILHRVIHATFFLVIVLSDTSIAFAATLNGTYTAVETWSFSIQYPDGTVRTANGTETGIVLVYDDAIYDLGNHTGVANVGVPSSRTLSDVGGGKYQVTGDIPLKYFSAQSPTVAFVPLTCFVVQVQVKGDGVNYELFNPSRFSATGPLTSLTGNASGFVTYQGASGTFSVSSTVVLTPSGGSPVIEQQPQAITLDPGTSGSLLVVAGGLPPMTFQWSKDGVDLAGATSDRYSFSGFSSADVGNYRVRVANSQGTTTSAAAAVALGGEQIFSFTNSTAITVPAINTWITLGTPYPSAINVAGISGSIKRVRATLRNFSANLGRDNDILLVGPGGKNVLLMSDVDYWGNDPFTNITVTFDDSASRMSRTQPTTSGTYAPTDFTAGIYGDYFPTPGPGTGPFGDSLSVFNGLAPAGAWSLCVSSESGEGAKIASGWSLELTLSVPIVVNRAPAISDIPDRIIPANGTTGPIAFIISDLETVPALLTLNKVSSDTNLVPTSNIVFAGSSSNRTVSITPASGKVGNARVTVLVSDGTNVTAKTFGVSVILPPTITVQPTNQTVILGNSATLNAQAAGPSPVAYQWRKDGTNIVGATNSSYIIANVQTNQAGIYSVLITYSAGIITSPNAFLTVIVPPSITNQPQNKTVIRGTNVVLSVLVVGSPPFGYQWQKDGSNLVGATNSSYAIVNVQTNHAGIYSVTVTNSAGIVTSSNAVLAILTPPTITLQPLGETAIAGNSATLSVTAFGTAPLAYQWRKGTTNIVGATNADYLITTVQTNHAGTYSVLITNVAGSVASSNAILTVIVPPSITSQPQSKAVNLGTNITFSVTAAGTVPLTYRWQKDGLPLSAATNASFSITGVQANQAGAYSVVVSNTAGTITSSNAVLTVNTPPLITGQPQSQTVVQGGSATLSVTSIGTAPLIYQWRKGTTNIVSATNATFFLANVQINHSGTYSVVVSNSLGSTISSNAVLTVAVGSAPGITGQPQNQSITVGGKVTLAVTAIGTAPLTYQWRKDAMEISGATNLVYALTNAQTNQAGIYSVLVSNLFGSVLSSNTVVSVIGMVIQRPPLQSLQKIQNQGFVFAMPMEAGRSYRVQASTNLFTWLDLTNLVGDGVLFQFSDVSGINYDRRFYRLVSP